MTSYRNMFRAKIHRARVTAADLEYEGSITIDPVLMEAAGILPFERVQVLNLSNAARAETYAIQGLPNSGDIVLNGALARLAYPGDPVIILENDLVKVTVAPSQGGYTRNVVALLVLLDKDAELAFVGIPHTDAMPEPWLACNSRMRSRLTLRHSRWGGVPSVWFEPLNVRD